MSVQERIPTPRPHPPRERVLLAVLELLDEGDTAAVSTRAISARAGVQAPAIYRLFGDKNGLLVAAAEHAYATWVANKSSRPQMEDPVEALRAGWDDAVQFGLDHPAVYRTANASLEHSPATQFGRELLREKIQRVARAGRLGVSAEHAVTLFHATGRGIILALLDEPEEMRDLRISDLARDAAIDAITATPTDLHPTLPTTAATLRALLDDDDALYPAERQLMDLWLQRIASGGSVTDGDRVSIATTDRPESSPASTGNHSRRPNVTESAVRESSVKPTRG